MSDSLRTVGNGTFMNAGLTEITLPNSLTGLGSRFFAARHIRAVRDISIFWQTSPSEPGRASRDGVPIPR